MRLKVLLIPNNKSQVFIDQKWMKSHPDTWSVPLFAPQWECEGLTPESSAHRCQMLRTWPPPSPSHACETEPSCCSWRGDIGGNSPSAQILHAALAAAARDLPLTQQKWGWMCDRGRWSGEIWDQILGCWDRVLLAGGAQTPVLPCWVFLPRKTNIINTRRAIPFLKRKKYSFEDTHLTFILRDNRKYGFFCFLWFSLTTNQVLWQRRMPARCSQTHKCTVVFQLTNNHIYELHHCTEVSIWLHQSDIWNWF